MSRTPRLLFVASPSAAEAAAEAVRLGGDVEAHPVTSADALQDAFSGPGPRWDGVVVVPGGPVDDVEVAVYVPDGVPLVVVAEAVPLLLTETAAQPVSRADLPDLLRRLESGALLAPGLSGDGTAAAALALSIPTHPAARPDGSPAPAAASAPMLDSPFDPPSAPSADAPDAPEAEADVHPEDAPAADAPEAGPDALDTPVLIVRAKSGDGAAEATLPELPADPPEDATIVEEHDEDRAPSILVVEDNNDTRMLLERILRSSYDVTAVGDARAALQAMNGQRFDGLVLDINLGGKETGADVLRIARSLPGYDDVFSIALTAYALPGDRERLLEAGFDEYISKPFTRQSLLESLAAGIRV